jgi:hypothetical protein
VPAGALAGSTAGAAPTPACGAIETEGVEALEIFMRGPRVFD